MNSENLRQSLVSIKEPWLDFTFCTNSGNGPLSNKKFPARIWQRLDNFFLIPYNSRNAAHFVLFEGSFCINTSKRFFWMTNNFIRLQYSLAVFDLGLKLRRFERATRLFMDTHFDTHFVHSVWNMVFLTEDAIFRREWWTRQLGWLRCLAIMTSRREKRASLPSLQKWHWKTDVRVRATNVDFFLLFSFQLSLLMEF